MPSLFCFLKGNSHWFCYKKKVKTVTSCSTWQLIAIVSKLNGYHSESKIPLGKFKNIKTQLILNLSLVEILMLPTAIRKVKERFSLVLKKSPWSQFDCGSFLSLNWLIVSGFVPHSETLYIEKRFLFAYCAAEFETCFLGNFGRQEQLFT